jgi:hypothetical protein
VTWYAAYDRNHELIGMLCVADGSVIDQDLRSHKSAQLTGVRRKRLNQTHYSVSTTLPLFHITVKLEEVWSEKRPIFSYVTLLNEENPMAWPVMDPEVRWAGVTFVSLGTSVIDESCTDRGLER